MPETHDFMQLVGQEQKGEALAIERAYQEGRLPPGEAAAFEAGLLLGAASGTQFGANRARMDLLQRQREERIARLGVTDPPPSDRVLLVTRDQIERDMPGSSWSKVQLPEAVKRLGRSESWINGRLSLIRKAQGKPSRRKRSA